LKQKIEFLILDYRPQQDRILSHHSPENISIPLVTTIFPSTFQLLQPKKYSAIVCLVLCSAVSQLRLATEGRTQKVKIQPLKITLKHSLLLITSILHRCFPAGNAANLLDLPLCIDLGDPATFAFVFRVSLYFIYPELRRGGMIFP